MKTVKSKNLKLKPTMNATTTAASARVPLCRCRFCGAVVSLDPVAGEFISEQGGVQVEHCEHLLAASVRVRISRSETSYITEGHVDFELLHKWLDQLRPSDQQKRRDTASASTLVAGVMEKHIKPRDLQIVRSTEFEGRLPKGWRNPHTLVLLTFIFARDGAGIAAEGSDRSKSSTPRNAKRSNRRSAGLRARAIASRRPR